jgi:hypothetical protein
MRKGLTEKVAPFAAESPRASSNDIHALPQGLR